VTSEPSSLLATTHALHAVAEHVVAAELHRHTGRIGLRVTPDGFGTPWFETDGARRRVRVEGTDLVLEDDRRPGRTSLATLRSAAALLGVEAGSPDVYTAVTPLEPDEPLAIDASAARRVARWFALVDDGLRRFSEHHADSNPSEAQLWPEHFDLAISMNETNFGGSPPDDEHPLPYLYVGPWTQRQGDFWSEPFGASLNAATGLGVDDAVAFFEEGHRRARTDPVA
jgi:hypothetical protein